MARVHTLPTKRFYGGLPQWKSQVKEHASWTLHLIRRLRVTQTQNLQITSPQTGCSQAEVLILLHHTLFDKIWCLMDQTKDWVKGGFKPYDRPLWLKDQEWHNLCTVWDSRGIDPNEFPMMEDDTRVIKGTGFTGLCEYDLEEAVRLWFKSKGVIAGINYKSVPELSIV